MSWVALRRIIPALVLVVLLSACRYPATATPAGQVTAEVIPVKPILTAPTMLALQAASKTPTAASSTSTPVQTEPDPTEADPTASALPSLSAGGQPDGFGVIWVKPGDELPAYRSPGTGGEKIHSFAYDETGIQLTGSQKAAGSSLWVEVVIPGGDTGWINRHYLTESIPAAVFCADPAVQDLLNRIKATLASRDGVQWSALVSPIHGLDVQYLRGGTIANYSLEESRWMFGTSYVTDWGLHPGSGLPVRGTFQDEVLPKLMDVYRAEFSTTCNDIRTGGTTYETTWSAVYRNINFVTLFRPGPPDQELDWRSLLYGIEYVEGKPYLFAINHLFWEP
jgi:hypothetical protein